MPTPIQRHARPSTAPACPGPSSIWPCMGFTLLLVDDFFGQPVPELKCRVKIKLRTQDIDIFEHTEEQYRSLVYLKSRFMHPDMEGYAKQVEFDEQLRSIPELDLSGYGPPPDFFKHTLARYGTV